MQDLKDPVWNIIHSETFKLSPVTEPDKNSSDIHNHKHIKT